MSTELREGFPARIPHFSIFASKHALHERPSRTRTSLSDRMHNGHYYKTKDPEGMKQAIFDNLEYFGEILGEKSGRKPLPVSLEGVRVEKVGRNAPCPCGSGIKYKKCCLNKEQR